MITSTLLYFTAAFLLVSATNAVPYPDHAYTNPAYMGATAHIQAVPELDTTSRIIPRCSMEWCTMTGAHSSCHVPHPPLNKVISCFMYWFSPESHHQCSFICQLSCLPPQYQPMASNGKKYCRVCQLRSFSCQTLYIVYGPVDHPQVPPYHARWSLGF